MVAGSVTASVTASNKVYDGTTAATITNCILTGVQTADRASVGCSAAAANFSDPNIGNGKTVTATGITLTGSAAGNYTLSSTSATTTANITAAPSLFGSLTSKQGLQNARVWTFDIGNSGGVIANGAQISSVAITQTALGGGSACRPVIVSPASFPLSLGNIAAGSAVPAGITINFTGCANTAEFSVLLQLSASNGNIIGSILRDNEER